MDHVLYETVVAQLLDSPRKKWPAIAIAAAVPLPTLTKIAYKQIDEPGVHKIERLAAAMKIHYRPMRNAA